MKKMLMAGVLLLAAVQVRADGSLLDQIYAGFVGNAKFAIESTTDGGSHGEFLDNFIEIGQLNGGHIAAIDSGVLGTFLPGNDQFRAAEWTTGGKLHLSPLIESYVRLPDNFQFIGNLEIDLRGSYNWSAHHPFYGIVAAYPFK